MKKPAISTIPEWYQGYVAAVPDVDLMKALSLSHEEFLSSMSPLTEQQAAYRYADDKWSVKDLLLHISDAERVFSYRALRFSRMDQTNLPGYDHNNYVTQAHADHRTLQSLLDEYKAVRAATVELFRSFSDEELKRGGQVGVVSFTALALGFIISGHQLHHLRIIKERYLPNLASS